MLHVAVNRFTSDGNTISYVLPVVWMTSFFHIMHGRTRPESNTMCIFRPVRQVAAPGAKSDVPDCIVVLCYIIIMHRNDDFRLNIVPKLFCVRALSRPNETLTPPIR